MHAQHNIGLLYRDGKGVKKNLVVAYAWLTLATRYHHRDAGYERGDVAKILSIEQIQQGKKLADKWEETRLIEEVSYDPALSDAQAGAVEQFNTGLAYEEGRGVEKDYRTAEEWYTKAAENEYLQAQLKLAQMYEVGPIGVVKSFLYAKQMYRKARENGYPEAKKELERLDIEEYQTVDEKPEATTSYIFVGSMGENSVERYYANRSGVHRKGNIAIMSIIIDYENEKVDADGDAYFSFGINMEFDCKKNRSRFIKYTQFAEHDGEGDEIEIDFKIGPWDRIPKKSMSTILFKVACGLV